eukprot:5592168-Amphidinium_carterae.1
MLSFQNVLLSLRSPTSPIRGVESVRDSSGQHSTKYKKRAILTDKLVRTEHTISQGLNFWNISRSLLRVSDVKAGMTGRPVPWFRGAVSETQLALVKEKQLEKSKHEPLETRKVLPLAQQLQPTTVSSPQVFAQAMANFGSHDAE